MRDPSILGFTALVLCSATAAARDEIAGPVDARIVRVIDGDTLLVEAMPWPQQTMKVYVRIRGIDAPEMHSKCAIVRRAALDARHALEELTTQSGRIKLTRIAGDKYFGRILADVTLANGRNPAQDLISTGHAGRYDGGRKPKETCSASE